MPMTFENEILLKQVPCGIFACTEDGVITMANTYCSNLLEYEETQLIGTNISTILTLSGRIFYQTHLYPLVKLHRDAEEIFLNLVTRSKKDVPVVLNAVLATTKSGTAIVYSFIPVLNRRKYEDEILQAKKNAEDALRKNVALEKIKQELELQQKELDKQITLLTFQNKELLQLGNVITHDLQEPLRKLMLFSHELLSGELSADEKEVALSAIKRSSQKIKNLLLNLQEYLSLSTDSSEKTSVDLQEVLQYELQQLQSLHSHIKVHAEIAVLPSIKGCKKQLHLLFHQLIKNAFDHGTTDNNLFLVIRSVIVKENLFNSLHNRYEYIDYAKITITDSGPGFDNRYKEYIFDFLKKLDPATTSDGFGLAFCIKIVENHFGNIKADGAVGIGATFTLMLPIDYVY
jgi:sigma-B regulation protein RsbU (phosphoserine phosphatase)